MQQHGWTLRAGAGDTKGQILRDSSHMECPEGKKQESRFPGVGDDSLLLSTGFLLGVGY